MISVQARPRERHTYNGVTVTFYRNRRGELMAKLEDAADRSENAPRLTQCGCVGHDEGVDNLNRSGQ